MLLDLNRSLGAAIKEHNNNPPLQKVVENPAWHNATHGIDWAMGKDSFAEYVIDEHGRLKLKYHANIDPNEKIMLEKAKMYGKSYSIGQVKFKQEFHGDKKLHPNFIPDTMAAAMLGKHALIDYGTDIHKGIEEGIYRIDGIKVPWEQYKALMLAKREEIEAKIHPVNFDFVTNFIDASKQAEAYKLLNGNGKIKTPNNFLVVDSMSRLSNSIVKEVEKNTQHKEAILKAESQQERNTQRQVMKQIHKRNKSLYAGKRWMYRKK